MRHLMVVVAGLAVGLFLTAHASACVLDVTTSAWAAPAKIVSFAATAQGQKARTNFVKLYRKRIFRERVWFNGREGDLEKHAICKNGQWYITLTDLVRHLGGTIIWGPNNNYIQVRRKGVVVRVVPTRPSKEWVKLGLPSPVVMVAPPLEPGEKLVVWPVAIRLGDRTWVAVKPFAELLGASVTWNTEKARVDVTFTP